MTKESSLANVVNPTFSGRFRRAVAPSINAYGGIIWLMPFGCQPAQNILSLTGINTVMTDVTQILSQIECGDTGAVEKLVPLLYKELRKLCFRMSMDEAHFARSDFNPSTTCYPAGSLGFICYSCDLFTTLTRA
jgi:hypothetical protein